MVIAPNAFAIFIQAPTRLRVSVDYYMLNIWCNVWMLFIHEDMTKNIFIMIDSLTLKCCDVKSFVKMLLYDNM